MSATEYVHVGVHADILSSGRSVGPGERIPGDELTDEDKHLIDEGHIVDVKSFDEAPSNSPDAAEAPDAVQPVVGPPASPAPPAPVVGAEPVEELTKTELQARARDLEIDGRSKMSADELREAIAEREAEAPAAGQESEG